MKKHEYYELVGEINEDLEEEILTVDDEVQILRDENGKIIDWYYSHDIMIKDYSDIVIYDEELTEQVERVAVFAEYVKIKPELEPISVKKLLDELLKAIEK